MIRLAIPCVAHWPDGDSRPAEVVVLADDEPPRLMLPIHAWLGLAVDRLPVLRSLTCAEVRTWSYGEMRRAEADFGDRYGGVQVMTLHVGPAGGEG